MFGQILFGDEVYGHSQQEPSREPAASSNGLGVLSTTGTVVRSLISRAARTLFTVGEFVTLEPIALKLLGPTAFSEQIADAAATTTRRATLYYAERGVQVLACDVECDADVIASPSDYAMLELVRFADGAALSSPISAPISTDTVGFTARSKRSFQWNSYLALAAGDTLAVQISKIGLGVPLPKFTLRMAGKYT